MIAIAPMMLGRLPGRSLIEDFATSALRICPSVVENLLHVVENLLHVVENLLHGVENLLHRENLLIVIEKLLRRVHW
jgi:hypothetical protein